MKRQPIQALKFGPQIDAYKQEKMTYPQIAKLMERKIGWVKAIHYRWLKEQYRTKEMTCDFGSFDRNFFALPHKQSAD